MNRPARFTVADLRRAIRAVEQSGEGFAVEIAMDGTIRIVRLPAGERRKQQAGIEPHEEIVF